MAAQFRFGLRLVGGLVLAGFSAPAVAQIVPDSTLGAERSEVRPDRIRGVEGDRIDGGAVRGSNLFHSFERFGIEAGRAAYFSNPDGIANIFSRVTGSTPSTILGRLGVLGGANLFLINPNGIVLGENASLDVGGSFTATTANAVQFGDRVFSATAPEPPAALLTINPSAFLFSQTPAPITVGLDPTTNPSGLSVADNSSLVLLGGETVIGGRLEAPGGRLEVAAIAEPGTVGLAIDDRAIRLNVPPLLDRADVGLANAVLLVAAEDAGEIVVRADDLTLGLSIVQAGIAPSSGSVDSQGGNIFLDAAGELNLLGSTVINRLEANARGSSGDIRVRAGALRLAGGSQITTSGLAAGDTGSLYIHVADEIVLDGALDRVSAERLPTVLNTSAVASGDAGDISITAQSLSLFRSTAIVSSAFSTGDAGDISIRTRDGILLSRSGIFSSVEAGGVGQAGNLQIRTDALRMLNGARLAASAQGQGDAGSIRIQADNSVALRGAAGELVTTIATNAQAIGDAGDISITARALSMRNSTGLISSAFGRGDSGNISVQAATLSIADESVILTSIFGTGNAGNLDIQASDAVLIQRDSGILSSIEARGFGQAGNIRLRAGSLSLIERANLQSVVRRDPIGLPPGAENAGDIDVQVEGDIVISGRISGLFSGNLSNGTSGDIRVEARSINLINGAFSSFTGGLPRFADDDFNIGTTNTDAGSIQLRADDRIFLRGNSNIVTSSLFGDAGDLTLEADAIIAFDNSNILAFSAIGRGGNIRLATPAFFGESYDPSFPPILNEENAQQLADLLSNVVEETGVPRVDINASGVLAGGEIAIPDVNFVQNSLAEVPEAAIDTDQLLANSCIARSDEGGTFLITGSDGLPERPGDRLTSPYPTGAVRSTPASDSSNSDSAEPLEGAIEEPQNLYQLSDGRLVMSRDCD